MERVERWMYIPEYKESEVKKMEQRLINANALNRKDVNCANFPMNFIDTAPTVLTIPENPTNGDMIKALFGKDISNECIDYLCKIRKCGEWWNAPYKKESD